MSIAVLPPPGGGLFHRATTRTAVPDSRLRYRAPAAPLLRPVDRLARMRPRTVPGLLARRLTNLSVYVLGALISVSIGPLIYAIGDRETAGRWILDVLALVVGS